MPSSLQNNPGIEYPFLVWVDWWSAQFCLVFKSSSPSSSHSSLILVLRVLRRDLHDSNCYRSSTSLWIMVLYRTMHTVSSRRHHECHDALHTQHTASPSQPASSVYRYYYPHMYFSHLCDDGQSFIYCCDHCQSHYDCHRTTSLTGLQTSSTPTTGSLQTSVLSTAL